MKYKWDNTYTSQIPIIYNEQRRKDERRIISFRFWIKKLLNRWFEVAYWLYLSLHRTGWNSANPDWLSVQSLRTTVTEDERIMQYDPWQCHASEGSLSENRRANCTLRLSCISVIPFGFLFLSTNFFINIRILNSFLHTNSRENARTSFRIAFRLLIKS